MTKDMLGARLDELVAEKIMGYKKDKWGHLLPPDILHPIEIPDYSTDIAAAWLVVDRLSKEYFVSFDNELGDPWICELTPKDGDGYPVIGMNGKTAPHAICLAALKALK